MPDVHALNWETVKDIVITFGVALWAAAQWQRIRRKPPVNEEFALLRVDNEAIKRRLNQIEERLKEGDRELKEIGKAEGGQEATIQGLAANLHTLTNRVDTLISSVAELRADYATKPARKTRAG